MGFALLFSMLFELLGDKEEYVVLGLFPLCVVILLVIVFTGNAAYTGNVQNVLGGYSAVALGYFLEKRYVKLDVKTKDVYKRQEFIAERHPRQGLYRLKQ